MPRLARERLLLLLVKDGGTLPSGGYSMGVEEWQLAVT